MYTKVLLNIVRGKLSPDTSQFTLPPIIRAASLLHNLDPIAFAEHQIPRLVPVKVIQGGDNMRRTRRRRGSLLGRDSRSDVIRSVQAGWSIGCFLEMIDLRTGR